jgi:predicted GNAT superfamily acetyltransferase
MAEPAGTGVTLDAAGIVYRPLDRRRGEHAAAVDLQGRIWDPDMATPVHQLIAADSCGGVVLGAFQDDALVGFSYGFPAQRDGEVWLHSHQTGVGAGLRDRRIGETLKWLQRDVALRHGYERITWTFDALQARNGYVNLVKLGAVADAYIADYYGELPDAMNEGLPSDRLWITWRLTDTRVGAGFAHFLAAAGIAWPAGPATATTPDDAGDDARPARAARPGDDGPAAFPTRAARGGARVPDGDVTDDLDGPEVLIETPADLDAVRAVLGDEAARTWRARQRAAFTTYLDREYVVTGFTTREDGGARRCWYVLSTGGVG